MFLLPKRCAIATDPKSQNKATVIRRRAGAETARVVTTATGEIRREERLKVAHAESGRAELIRLAAERLAKATAGDLSLTSTVTLRPDQANVYADLAQYFADAASHLALSPQVPFTFGRFIQPPRTGKMVIIAQTIAGAGVTALILVPTQNLVLQAVKELRSKLPGVQVGMYYGEDKEVVKAGVNVATYQIVQQHAQAGKLPEPIRQSMVVFCDEAHHAMTEARQTMLQLAFDPGALRIACTATPDYSEQRTLAMHFPCLIHEITLQEAMSMDLFARLRVQVMSVAVDGSSLKTVGGDFDASLLGGLMAAAPFLEASRVLRYEVAGNAAKPALICCASVAQAREVHDYLVRTRPPGTPAPALILGEDSDKRKRQRHLDAFESGEIDTLVNVGVLIEGWDSPRCKLEIDLAPTLSEVRAKQKYFRVMTKFGLEEALIYVLLPERLREIPIFPQMLFGNSVQLEGYEDWLAKRPATHKKPAPKPDVDGPTNPPKLAEVQVQTVVLHDFDSQAQHLNPKSLPHVREVIRSAFEMEKGLPTRQQFSSTVINHPLFQGLGEHLLRYCGVRKKKGSYPAFMSRLFPEAVANRKLVSDELHIAELPSCAEVVKDLFDRMLAGYDDSDGWRALFGPDDEVADPCDLYVRQSQWQRVVQGIETHLTDRQRFVLAKRFGMADDDREEHVREDIGRMMNLSRERVRNIEIEALTRLRDLSPAEAWDASLHSEHSTFEELVGWYAADFTEAYFCGIFRGSEVWVAQAEEGDYVCVWGHYRWFYFETRPWLFVQGDSLWALRFHPDTQTFRSELVTS